MSIARTLRLPLAVVALLGLLAGAGPVAAADGAAFGDCVAHHATTEAGFTGDHNPGMHEGLAGWPGCP